MALIKGKQLADSAIVEAKIADGAVTADKLAGSIPVGKLDMTGTFDFSSVSAFHVPDPSLDTHVATKKYVDDQDLSVTIPASTLFPLEGDDYVATDIITGHTGGTSLQALTGDIIFHSLPTGFPEESFSWSVGNTEMIFGG